MTDYKKTDAELEAAKNITLDEMAEAAADMTAEKQASDLRRASLNGVRLTLAGDPLPIDPDTGEIDTGKLTAEQLTEIKKAIKPIAETFIEVSPGIKNIRDSVNHLQEQIRKSSGIEKMQIAFKTLSKSLVTDEMRDLLREMRENLQPIQDLIDELDELKPYIKAELKKEEYGGLTFDNLMEYTPRELLEMKADPDSLFYKVLEAAIAARDKALLTEPYNADKMLLPTDKINLFAWDLRETGGQIKFDLSRAGTDDGATALFSLSFDDDPNVKITKEINHFDKRVMSVVGTAFNSGHPIISATGIYYAMGGTGKPSTATIERIDKALTKLDMGKVFIDNRVEANKYNYDHFKKEDRLLHFKRVTAISNGKISDTFIQILEEPILMTFARQRKQISAVPMKVLKSTVSKTNNHLRIEDYLLWRIVQQKNTIKKLRDQQKKKYTQQRQKQIKEAAQLTILLKTLYDHTGYSKKDSTAKKRARATVEDYLNHYQSEAAGQWITGYKIDKDRIVITLPIK